MWTALLLSSCLASAQATPPPTPAEPPEKEKDKADEEPKKADTKYFVEKLLAGTRFGQTLADCGIKVYGWTDLSYTAGTTSRTNHPVTFNDFANSFQLNQNWLTVSKAVDTSKQEVQYGFNVSLLYGTDYRFTRARGFLQYQVEDGNQVGLDIIYHYAEAFLPNLGGQGTSVRIGRWASAIGYEVNDAVNTPFVSRSYIFQYNPFTHTGVQANTQINDDWSMYHGLVTGSDVYIDPAARLTYVGGVKYAPKNGKGSLAFNAIVGPGRYLGKEEFLHPDVFNVVGTYNVTDTFTYVADATFSTADKFPAGFGNVKAPGTSANWYGVANYFIYKCSGQLTSNLRVELFNDTKGVRTGFEGLYTEATYGLTYTPKDWLLIRPFARYDYNSRSRPFEGDHHLATAGLEAIVRW